jgi:hypothetical protein
MKKKPKLITILAWILTYLLIIDVGINVIFPYPKDPRNISPSALALFFEYGRSVEGKLARMTKRTDEGSAPILTAGWISNPLDRAYSSIQTEIIQPTIGVYGMSHSVLLADDMAKLDPSLTIRACGAPGAVPSWSYAAYLSDRKQHHSDVVILGIMTIGVPLICTTSGTTNHFDRVWPYTYPRLVIHNGTLDFLWPPFISLDGYREYFYDSVKWGTYVRWLKENDKYYDPVLYRKTVLDKSSIFRMIRRTYAYSSRGKKDAEVYDDRHGFNKKSEEVKILLSIIENFAEKARQDNSIPVIYIVNNLFTGSRLYDLLESTLLDHHIPFLSSHSICAPNDPRNYLPDTHFVPKKNLELAKAMLQVIRGSLKGNSVH